MNFAPENFGIAGAGLTLLRDLVHERTGIFFDDQRLDQLTDRIGALILARGFGSFLDYYYLLKYDEREAAPEWARVLDALSVQETYFWREVDQIETLAGSVMETLARQSPNGPIRIWSVPCASGEEPLSIAMALDERGWFDRVPIEIHASDGSGQAIARAKAGMYRNRSFRALPDRLREKYFAVSDQGYSPMAALRERITSWSVVNLLATDEVAARANTPVIFCRNAFIYFSPAAVTRVVNQFADCMRPPGYLFVAASESLLSLTDRFRLEDIDGAFVYVKR